MNPETRIYDKHWMPWLKKQLEASGIKTLTLLMPEPWKPGYEKFRDEFEKYPIDQDSILIGHSCGTSFLVRWLGESKKKIKMLILVAPWKFYGGDDKNEISEKFYDYEIDESIKSRVGKIIMFNADNEYETGKRSLDVYKKVLGGETISLPGRGHYTLEFMKTEEFPELLDLILKA